jgi:hypothetical protein
MEAQTESIYNKLRKAESFLQQIPEDFRIKFDFRLVHLESDFVGVSYCPRLGDYVGTSVDNIKSISVKERHDFLWIEMETNGSSVTLYQNGFIHMTLF